MTDEEREIFSHEKVYKESILLTTIRSPLDYLAQLGFGMYHIGVFKEIVISDIFSLSHKYISITRKKSLMESISIETKLVDTRYLTLSLSHEREDIYY
jgi:hypothetical protein